MIKIERPEGDFARGYDTACAARAPISCCSTAARSRLSRHQERGRPRPARSFVRPRRRPRAEPGAGGGARAGFGAAEMRAEPAAGHGRHLGLRRDRPLSRAPRLRPAGAGRERPRFDHRLGRTRPAASACRPATRCRHVRARRHPRSVAAARRTGDGAGSRSRCSRRCRVDDGAAASSEDKPVRVAAPRARPSLHRSLRRYPTGAVPILIAVQNDKEWARLCTAVLERPAMVDEPALRHQRGAQRHPRRDQRHRQQRSSGGHTWDTRSRRSWTPPRSPTPASARCGDLATHPQVRRTTIATDQGDVSLPALAASWNGEPERLGDVPTVGQHSEQVRREFGA